MGFSDPFILHSKFAIRNLLARCRILACLMKVPDRFLKLTFVAVLLLFLFPLPVQAYIDPGTGSYVLQIILASIAAALLGIKYFWSRIRSVFSRAPSEQQEEKEKD